MAPQITDQKWYSIAEQASTEMDSAKLTILVDQLCSALDECGKPPHYNPPGTRVMVNCSHGEAILYPEPVTSAGFRMCLPS
jgi:hypothetical protein